MFQLVKLLLSFIIFVMAYKIVKIALINKSISRFTVKIISSNLRKNAEGYFSYERIEKYMKSTGVDHLVNERFSPTGFIIVKIISAILFFMLGISCDNVFLAFILMIIGFFVFDIMIEISNKDDNEKILKDLKKVYDTLRIQSKANVFLTQSLAECYLITRNKRLKKALLELNAKIIANTDINEAIEDFGSKFKSIYIEQFCIVIKQSLESGKKVKILEDLSEQIRDIDEALAKKEEEKMKLKLEFYQFLIYIGVTGIIVYGIINELTSSLMNF